MISITIRPALFALLLATTAGFAQQKMDDMKGMDMGKEPVAKTQSTHHAKATVKNVDEKDGTVTLAHGPVGSLNWPAMTMKFKVKDKMLLKKLDTGRHVEVELVKEGKDYVVTAVK